jgi:membrane dipeptidase
MSTEITQEQFGNYDFGLSAEEETRATRVHSESIIIDMLYWGPFTHRSFTEEMEKEILAFWEACHDPSKTALFSSSMPIRLAVRNKLPQFKELWDASGVTGGSRSVDGFNSIQRFAFTFGNNISMFDHIPWLIKALSADDFFRAKAEGKHAGWINAQLQGGIERNFIDLIEPSYNLGLRMIQLSYTNMTFIGAGCTERTDAGVSNYGANVIALMNKLGIIVDTGHCGHQTTLDACALSIAPVVASHTSAKGVYNHPRGKSDEELRAIAGTGGVIGVVAVPFFLKPGDQITIDAMLDHINYITNLVGWKHVAIGTDWPAQLPKLAKIRNVFDAYVFGLGFGKEHKINSLQYVSGFDDYRDFPNITRGLVKRGYSDKEIKGILGENFLRVFKEVCG